VLFEIKAINCKCISFVCSEFFNTTYLNGPKKVFIDYILFVNITLILSETRMLFKTPHTLRSEDLRRKATVITAFSEMSQRYHGELFADRSPTAGT